jgi:hypothetical protein
MKEDNKFSSTITTTHPARPSPQLLHERSCFCYAHCSMQLIFKVVCSAVENLTCVGKSSGFWISRRIFSVCCESCLNSVGAAAATTRNGTCFDTCFKKDLQAAHAYIFLLFTKSLKNMPQKWGVSQLKAFFLTTLLLLLLGTQSNQSSMAKIGYFIPKSAILHNQFFFWQNRSAVVTSSAKVGVFLVWHKPPQIWLSWSAVYVLSSTYTPTLIVPAWRRRCLRAKIGVAYQRREIQNPELLPTQVRFSTEQSTLVVLHTKVGVFLVWHKSPQIWLSRKCSVCTT